jgi:hypothetical protein
VGVPELTVCPEDFSYTAWRVQRDRE